MSGVELPNPETMELLERRLAESVGDRVERTLKTRYGMVVAAALFVLGLSGYSAITNTVKDLVGTSVGPITKEAEKSIAQMNVQLDLARETKRRLDGLVDQINLEAESATRRIEEFQRRLAKLQEEFENVLGKLQDQLGSVVVRRRELEADLEATARSLEERQAQTRNDLATLAGEVRTLVARTGAPEAVDMARLDKSLAELAARARSTEDTASWTTIFVQFGGETSVDTAQALAKNLRDRRYLVPAPRSELTENREVRYFWNEDRSNAEAVAKDATADLAALGFKDVTIGVKNFTDYKGVKPRRGTVELWLALPAKRHG